MEMEITESHMRLERPGGGASSNQATSLDDLPEDVVALNIMSKVKLRDVVNFSVVSKRWIHIPSCLDSIMLNNQMAKNPNDQLCPSDGTGSKDAFIKGVHQFLQHYNKQRSRIARPTTLNYFYIFSCLTRDSTTDIDSWISIAIQNGVKNLIVNLICVPHMDAEDYPRYDDQYAFPWQLLDQYQPTVLKGLFLRFCLFNCRLTSKLTSLEIIEVYTTTVTQYDMDTVLQCCPNLQRLLLTLSKLPAKLILSGCDSLTCLVLQQCLGLEEIEVLSGGALTEFTYRGRLVRFNFINAPKLTNLAFSMSDYAGVGYVFQNLHRDFPAIRCLSIFRGCTSTTLPPPLLHLHGRMTSFLRLEELKLYIDPDCSFSLATMKEMLIACPVLRRLEIVPPCNLDDMENAPVPHPHKCLEFIKISGLCGGRGSVELAKFLVQTSEAVQHVFIERRVQVKGYFCSEHSANWHGEKECEAVKHDLLNLMRSGRLTFV